MPGRRERKRRELRRRMYEAARALFLAEGFDAVTVEQIAERADVARATFFNHYASKHALLREMAGEMNERFHRLIATECERDVSTADRLEHFFLASADSALRSRRFTRDLFVAAMHPGRADEERGRDIAAIRDSFAPLIRDGQRRGDVALDEDPVFLAEMVAGSFTALYMRWFHEDGYPLRDRARHTARFLARALEPGSAPAMSPS